MRLAPREFGLPRMRLLAPIVRSAERNIFHFGRRALRHPVSWGRLLPRRADSSFSGWAGRSVTVLSSSRAPSDEDLIGKPGSRADHADRGERPAFLEDHRHGHPGTALDELILLRGECRPRGPARCAGAGGAARWGSWVSSRPGEARLSRFPGHWREPCEQRLAEGSPWAESVADGRETMCLLPADGGCCDAPPTAPRTAAQSTVTSRTVSPLAAAIAFIARLQSWTTSMLSRSTAPNSSSLTPSP